MKINQIITEYEYGQDLEEEQAREWLKNFLESRGYKYMGEGQDAMVYRNSRGVVLKVYGLNQSQPLKRQLDFYRAAKGYNSPFIPRFGAAKNIKVKGHTYTIVPTEELSPNPTDPCMLDTLWTYQWVGDAYDENKPAIEALEDALGQYEKNEEIQLEIKSAIECLKRVGVNALDGYHTAYGRFCGDDLENSTNTMWRGNTPVINDPWAS